MFLNFDSPQAGVPTAVDGPVRAILPLLREPLEALKLQVENAKPVELNASSVANRYGVYEGDTVRKYCVEPFTSLPAGRALCDALNNYYPDDLSVSYAAVFGGTSNMRECLARVLMNDPAVSKAILPTLIPDIVMTESFRTSFLRGHPLFDLELFSHDGSGSLSLSAYLFDVHNYNEGQDYFDSASRMAIVCDKYAAIDLLKEKMQLVDAALDIVAGAHDDVRFANLKAVFLYHFAHEMSAISMVDVWQDMSACKSAGCKFDNDFSKSFAEISDPEIAALWRTASMLSGNKLEQGYGPTQIILGLAMEAAADEQVASRYRALLPADAFDGEDGMLRTLISFEGSIVCLAMVYDFVMTRLEETLLAAPDSGFLVYSYPFISTGSVRREMALLQLTKMLTVFPENDAIAKVMLSNGALNTVWSKVFLTAQEFGLELELPGIEFKFGNYNVMSLMYDRSMPVSDVRPNLSDRVLLMLPQPAVETAKMSIKLFLDDAPKKFINLAMAVTGLEISPNGRLTAY